MEKDLNTLSLGETMIIDDYYKATAVPGGWIFRCTGGECVFVPYAETISVVNIDD